MIFRTDCRYWRGDKPCKENRLCQGCPAYQGLGPRILIIKLGARGDVLRTTPLLAGLRRVHPAAHITWLTASESMPLLAHLPGLDQSLAWSSENLSALQARKFEIAVCLDKEPHALGLMTLIQAERKLGWGMAADGVGTAMALNPEAEYSLALGVCDDLKFRQNQKHYLQIIFEACGLTYQDEKYAFVLQANDRARAQSFFLEQGLKPGQPVVGLFTGCGPAFQHKRWHELGFAQLAIRIQKELGAAVLLMAGPEEQPINQKIRDLMNDIGGGANAFVGVDSGATVGAIHESPLHTPKSSHPPSPQSPQKPSNQHPPIMDTHGQHSLRELAGFLDACCLVVTGDTLAMHLALALGRPTLALFGPTCPQEITMFGLGEKLMTPAGCAPCYRHTCETDPDCMQQLSLETVWAACLRIWRRDEK